MAFQLFQTDAGKIWHHC